MLSHKEPFCVPTHFISDPLLFQRQLEANQEFVAAGYPKLDRAMRPIIDRLNSIPGIATTDCCCCHPGTDKTFLYVAALVTEPGLAAFSDVYVQLVEEFMENPETAIWARQVSMSVRHRYPGKKRTPTFVWTIRIPCTKDSLRALFVAEFIKAIDNVIYSAGTRPVQR